MAGIRSKANPNKKYQGWFVDASGKQRYFIGTCSKADTLFMARKFEDEHRQIRLG